MKTDPVSLAHIQMLTAISFHSILQLPFSGTVYPLISKPVMTLIYLLKRSKTVIFYLLNIMFIYTQHNPNTAILTKWLPILEPFYHIKILNRKWTKSCVECILSNESSTKWKKNIGWSETQWTQPGIKKETWLTETQVITKPAVCVKTDACQ